MTRPYFFSLPLPFIFALACSSNVDGGDSNNQSSTLPDTEVGGDGDGTAEGDLPADGGQSCALLCEETEVTTPAGPDGCTAEAWQAGAYSGGSTVSLNGKEYTSVYWTESNPETDSGPSGSGAPWSEGVACAGSSGEPVTTTKLVCCPDQGEPDSGTDAPAGEHTVGEFLTKELFDQMFPNHDAFYTFDAFVEASKSFPAFTGQGSDEVRKRELAAFLGNVGHETTGGWATAPGGPQAWGLYFTQELNCEAGCPQYCQQGNVEYPCASGKSYHGRGPVQLSWNYNYGEAGSALGVDLVAQPELVSTDAVISFKTAIWFWMHGRSGGQQSPHDVMVAGKGFGETIRIINGSECNGGSSTSVANRVAYFERFTGMLNISSGSNLTC